MLVTLRDGFGGREAGVAKLFMENLKVLSVGSRVTRSTDNEPINATTATLEVTPSEAEQVALAMKEGNIQLVLRGYGDPDSVKTRGATEQDVLARLRDPALVAALRRAEDSVASEAAQRAAQCRAAERWVATRSAPTAAPAVPAPVLAAAKPDSVAVRVYRGGQVSQTKFEKTDSSTTRTP
jgi:Flp pilus assembly protein CpaB